MVSTQSKDLHTTKFFSTLACALLVVWEQLDSRGASSPMSPATLMPPKFKPLNRGCRNPG